jgi:glucosamine-6-phosphate deaminase
VAKGKRKASIVKAILESPITPDIPGSILQLHPNCEYLLQTDTIIL